MTEAEWLVCADPQPMLEFLRGRISDRKLRLMATVNCRRLPEGLLQPVSREALEVADRFAEDTADPQEIQSAQDAAWSLAFRTSGKTRTAVARAVATALSPDAWQSAYVVFHEILASGLLGWSEEFLFEATLLRHLVGNPFKPYPVPPFWPITVVQVAVALYEGQDCRLPLSDALEDSGHVELAEHFRNEAWHPKGCWALDLLLDKQ